MCFGTSPNGEQWKCRKGGCEKGPTILPQVTSWPCHGSRFEICLGLLDVYMRWQLESYGIYAWEIHPIHRSWQISLPVQRLFELNCHDWCSLLPVLVHQSWGPAQPWIYRVQVSSLQKLWLDLLLLKFATFVLLFCMKCLWASQYNESICGVVKCHTCKCRSWGVGSWTDCWIAWVLHRKRNNAWKIWCQSKWITFWLTIVRWSLCIISSIWFVLVSVSVMARLMVVGWRCSVSCFIYVSSSCHTCGVSFWNWRWIGLQNMVQGLPQNCVIVWFHL